MWLVTFKGLVIGRTVVCSIVVIVVHAALETYQQERPQETATSTLKLGVGRPWCLSILRLNLVRFVHIARHYSSSCTGGDRIIIRRSNPSVFICAAVSTIGQSHLGPYIKVNTKMLYLTASVVDRTRLSR